MADRTTIALVQSAAEWKRYGHTDEGTYLLLLAVVGLLATDVEATAAVERSAYEAATQSARIAAQRA